jgi:hypothetical protein
MRNLEISEVNLVSAGLMGSSNPLLLNCEDTANADANRVEGLAGMLGIDNVYGVVTGRDLGDDVKDFAYEACMRNGVYGTNQNLDTYDPNVGSGRAMCGFSPCPTSRTTTLGQP